MGIVVQGVVRRQGSIAAVMIFLLRLHLAVQPRVIQQPSMLTPMHASTTCGVASTPSIIVKLIRNIIGPKRKKTKTFSDHAVLIHLLSLDWMTSLKSLNLLNSPILVATEMMVLET